QQSSSPHQRRLEVSGPRDPPIRAVARTLDRFGRVHREAGDLHTPPLQRFDLIRDEGLRQLGIVRHHIGDAWMAGHRAHLYITVPPVRPPSARATKRAMPMSSAYLPAMARRAANAPS